MPATSKIGWRWIPRGLRDEQNEFDLSANQQGSIRRRVQSLSDELLLYTENRTHTQNIPKQTIMFFFNYSYKCRSVQKVRPWPESPFGFFFFVCACGRMSHSSISQRSRPSASASSHSPSKAQKGNSFPVLPFPSFSLSHIKQTAPTKRFMRVDFGSLKNDPQQSCFSPS